MGFLRYLWNLARFLTVPLSIGLRLGSRAAQLFGFLFLLFCIFFGVVALFGGDIGQVQAWFDRHAAAFDLAGTVLWKIVLGFVLLMCGLTFVAQFTNSREDRPGCFGIGVAVIIGYACVVGLFFM